MYKNYPVSEVSPGHPDFEELSEISALISTAGAGSSIVESYDELCRSAVDYVIDPVVTGRTLVADLDKNEKSFIGLKIEHGIVDKLACSRGEKYDLKIGAYEVDVKNSIAQGWAIPRETYSSGGVCLISAFDEDAWKCWLGLMKCRQEYLGKPNQDQKRGIPADSFRHMLWLVEGAPLAPSKWEHIDLNLMRALRNDIPTGNERASEFFRNHLNIQIHRDVLHSLLFDQLDYMKRIRGNGGARDLLGQEGIAIVSGHWLKERGLMKSFGLPNSTKLHIAALSPRNESEAELLSRAGLKRYQSTFQTNSGKLL